MAAITSLVAASAHDFTSEGYYMRPRADRHFTSAQTLPARLSLRISLPAAQAQSMWHLIAMRNSRPQPPHLSHAGEQCPLG